jgi:hypothetical protein
MGNGHDAGNGARLRLAAMAAVSRQAVSADMGPRHAARPAYR